MEHSKRSALKFLAGGAALAALPACGGGGGASAPTPITPPPVTVTPPPAAYSAPEGALRNAYANNFRVGAAIEPAQITAGSDDEFALRTQFNSITAENRMKPESLAPSEGVYDFSAADALVDYAIANGMQVRGHALVWHRATPDYFFQGTPAQVRARLEDYITAVVTHFRGRVFAWDVVNEAITDDGSEASAPYRDSNWYQAAGGPDYIDWAFSAARAADPDALLFLNDYNTELAGKRGRFLQVVQDMITRSIPIDGAGHQMHLQQAGSADDALAAIDAVDALNANLINHVTELDISIYNDPGSCFENQVGCAADYGNNPPASAVRSQSQKYRDLFIGFSARPSVTSVTTWGISDAQSWLNGYPVNRTNYPLLFDRNRDPKSAFRAVVDMDFTIP